MNNNTEFQFDYRRLTDDHKHAAAEIANMIENSGNKMLADNIRLKFELKTIPTFDISNSPFIKSIEKFDIKVNVQGFIHETDENGNEIKYPMIVVCDDIRKFDYFIENVK